MTHSIRISVLSKGRASSLVVLEDPFDEYFKNSLKLKGTH